MIFDVSSVCMCVCVAVRSCPFAFMSNVVLITTFKIIIQRSFSGTEAKLHGQTGRLNENGNYNVHSRQMSCICINDFVANHLVTSQVANNCASGAAKQADQTDRHTDTYKH